MPTSRLTLRPRPNAWAKHVSRRGRLSHAIRLFPAWNLIKGLGLIVLLLAPVALGQTIQELEGVLEESDPTLSGGEYYKVHTYEGQAGESLELYLRSEEFDPYLAVLDPEGNVLAEEDDSEGYGRDVLISLTLPTSGSYTLLVTSAFAGETGRYALSITRQGSESAGKEVDKLVTVTDGSDGPVAEPTPAPQAEASPAGGASRFFLPTGEEVYNTTNPTVESDGAGNVHMVYPSLFGGDAFYAYCPADCMAPEGVSVVVFDTDDTVLNIMIALDASETPQVLLSTPHKIYYATCAGTCTQESAWTVSVVMEHGGDREVSGRAFALDSQNRPRFLMHTYRTYLGIAQAEPATFYVLCDGDCHDSASWQAHKISDQIWQESQLRFTADDQARLATVATVEGTDFGAYLECDASCTDEDSWAAMTLIEAFSDRYTMEINPAISLALTQAGGPRIAILGKNEAGERALLYAYCDEDCTNDNWGAKLLLQNERLDAGLELVLDSQERPRVAYTYFGSIVMAYCDEACETADASWETLTVENAEDISADQVYYGYCTSGMWSLRYPSLSLAPDGSARLAYQARDISFGNNVDIYGRGCIAGVDLTLSRFARLESYR